MKIHELFEQADDLESMDEDEIIALIKRDCKPFIEENAGVLLRGMRKKSWSPFKQDVRQDRNPRNTRQAVQDVLDKWFDEKFGFKARSQAVFTTGSFPDARSYGTVYAIFPIGNFKYVWSTEIPDLFFVTHNISTDNPEEVIEKLEEADYKSTDLEIAIKTGHEVMLSCKQYYAIPLHLKSDVEPLVEKIFGKK